MAPHQARDCPPGLVPLLTVSLHDRRHQLITSAMANHSSTAHTAIATGTEIETGYREVGRLVAPEEALVGMMWTRTSRVTKTTASRDTKKVVDDGTEIGTMNLVDGHEADRRRLDPGCLTESGNPEVEDRVSTAVHSLKDNMRQLNGDTMSSSKIGTAATQDTRATIEVAIPSSATLDGPGRSWIASPATDA